MGRSLTTAKQHNPYPKFVFDFKYLYLWPTVIIQKAPRGFYVTQVTGYHVWKTILSIWSTQP